MKNDATLQFIVLHDNEDTSRLLFGAGKYPYVDMQFAARAIEARKKVKGKIPQWYRHPGLEYPAMINVEQCSSQATALYKQRFIVRRTTPVCHCEEVRRTDVAIVRNNDCFGKPRNDRMGASHNVVNDNDTRGASAMTTDVTNREDDLPCHCEEGRSPDVAIVGNNDCFGKPRNDSVAIVLADLTGGLGVDTYFLSQIANEIDYIEQNAPLAEAAKNNFATLNQNNINVINTDSELFLQQTTKQYNLIYIDPARRGNIGQRVYSITDCQPNVVEIEELLFAHSEKVLIKASPMADVHHTLSLFPKASQLHIVSVENECKEVLILLEKGFKGEPQIFAVNITNNSAATAEELQCDILQFTLAEETNASVRYCSAPKKYIYQPNKSLLKGGCFKILCSKYGVEKIAQSTHLYTSDEVIDGFPGRRYKVIEVVPFNKQSVKYLAERYPAAEVEALNFPLSTNALKERLRLKGSDDKIKHFACTLTDKNKVIIVVQR